MYLVWDHLKIFVFFFAHEVAAGAEGANANVTVATVLTCHATLR